MVAIGLLSGDTGNKIINFEDYNAQTIGIILLGYRLRSLYLQVIIFYERVLIRQYLKIIKTKLLFSFLMLDNFH